MKEVLLVVLKFVWGGKLRETPCIVCLNSKFPPPVELCWQNKNISKLGIVITKVGNITTIRK
jgi:hypothetical protein